MKLISSSVQLASIFTIFYISYYQITKWVIKYLKDKNQKLQLDCYAYLQWLTQSRVMRLNPTAGSGWNLLYQTHWFNQLEQVSSVLACYDEFWFTTQEVR